MKKKMPVLLILLVLLLGAGLLAYPTVSNWLYQRNASRAIESYSTAVRDMPSEQVKEQWAIADSYNQALWSNGTQVYDPFGEQGGKNETGYLHVLGDTSVMVYLEIPSIDLSLPVYHGTGEEVLQRGAGHIEGTSVPVGGAGTHAVLTGHRGLSSAKLFTDLDKLELGDVFYIHVLGETIAYEVDQILVVEPDDTSALALIEGGDYVTLLTCTPYAINSHRLLVRGSRTGYQPQEQAVYTPKLLRLAAINWLLLLLALFALLWLVLFLLLRRRKKREGRHER